MRSSFGRDSSDGYCVAFAQSLGHVLMSYTPVGLYAGSLSRPRLTPETSVVPAYSKVRGQELCPIGAKREGKPRYSGAALRAHAVVSPLKFSASHSLLLFCGQKKSNETRLFASPYGKGRWCKAPEGIRRSVFDMANRESGETIPPSLPPRCTKGGWLVVLPFAQGSQDCGALRGPFIQGCHRKVRREIVLR